MPAVSADAPSFTITTPLKLDGADYEPDDKWKLQLRKRIEEGLQSMVADVKKDQAAESRKSPDTPETRLRADANYKQAMQTIRSLAMEQYQFELDRESSRRRGADYEPDDEWKLQLKKRIEEGLQSMVADAKENRAAELRKSPSTPEARLRINASYKQAMETIEGLATEQYQLELDREFNQRCGADYEPDLEWKLQLRKRIKDGLQSMVAGAKENRAAELRKSPNSPETRLRIDASYKQAMETIEGLATEQYQLELDREFNQRRWTAGLSMDPGWTQYFIEEQQKIMGNIKQSGNQTDKWDGSIGTPSRSIRSTDYHLSRSPPRPLPEIWKPAISPADISKPSNEMPIPRHNPSLEEPPVQSVWRGPAAEEARKTKDEEERNEKEATRREDILRRREEEMVRREAENLRREAEVKRKEEAAARKEETRKEEARKEEARKREESKLMAEHRRILQQAEFRKREEDIRRAREERRRNDSVGNDNVGPSPSYLPAPSGTSPGISRTSQSSGPLIPERSADPSSGGAGPAPTGGPSIKLTVPSAPTANRPSASASTGNPRTGSVSPGTYPMSNSPHTISSSEAERTRKQREFTESQEEQFRCAQAKLEVERQLKSQGRPLSRAELRRVFEHHARLWNRLNTLSELSWTDFPWPIAKPPSNPDDISLPQIGAYIYSPVYPDKNKSRTTRDRIKEHIRRWHSDHFETKLLPKVVGDEREKVKHGAGTVVRYLRDLLTKENESNNNINDLLTVQRENDPEGTKQLQLEAQTIVEDAPRTQEELTKKGKDTEMKEREDNLCWREELIRREKAKRTVEEVKEEESYATSFDGRETELSDEYDSDDAGDDNSFEDEMEVKRIRDLEAEMQKLEEDKREAEDELNRIKIDLQRLVDKAAREDEEKRKEEERKEEQARRREEDARKREEEMCRKEEEVRRKEEDAAKKEEEAKRKEQDAKKNEEAVNRKEDEARRKAEELSRREEEILQREAQIERDREITTQMQLEAQRITEDALKKQDELNKTEDSMRREVGSLRRGKEAVVREETGKDGNTLVTGGAFNFAEGDILINGSGKSPADKGIAKLFLKVASGAFHDSGELSDPLIMQCHPNTRAAIIQGILDWLDDLESPELVMWLHGATGAGKSAIAQTIAQLLSEQKQLSGSFFFARGSSTGRGDEKRLVPTLAYQLAKYLPDTRFHIAMTVVSDPAIFDLALRRQVQDLLINPLCIASNAASFLASPRLFIIDGLDECRDADAQCRILQVFTTAITSIQHQLPHKLLITSRSEMHLSAGFNNTATTYRQLSLDNSYLSG